MFDFLNVLGIGIIRIQLLDVIFLEAVFVFLFPVILFGPIIFDNIFELPFPIIPPNQEVIIIIPFGFSSKSKND